MNNCSLNIFEEMDSCARYWEYLENAAPCHPFQSYTWCRSLVDSFAGSIKCRLRICVLLEKDGAPLLLAPLCVTHRGLLRVAGFLDYGLADLNCPLLAPGARIPDSPTLFHSLLGALDCDVLELCKIPPVLADGRPNPFAGICKGRHGMSYHSATLDGTWEDFAARQFNGRTRRRDKHRRKKFEQAGSYGFEIAATPERAVEITKILLEMKLDWMKRKNLSGIVESQAAQDFYLRLAADGKAHVAALTLNGEILAANWSQVRGDRYYGILASYDLDSAQLSPGRLLLLELLRESIKAGYRRLELSIGDDDYKRRLTDRSMELYRHAAMATPQGLPYVALFRVKEYFSKKNRLRGLVKGTQRCFNSFFRRKH